MTDLAKIQGAIARENLGGWLFFNFHHRDQFSDLFLGIPAQRMNSRRWFYFIPVSGEPLKVCHAIEKGSLRELPGKTVYYSSQDALEDILSPLACSCAVAYSETLPTLSYLDHGTARLLERWGFRLHPAETLIQETLGVLGPEQIAAHETAAAHLYQIVELVWDRIKESMRRGTDLTEKEVQGWILREIEKRGLETEHEPIVAAGPNAGDPHYAPEEASRTLTPGDVIQFDLWARLPGPGGTFADISWVGYLGADPPEEVKKTFALVCRARDRAVEFIRQRLAEGKPPRGSEVDDEARQVIFEGGQEDFLFHRTGHGIDAELHGWGVNLDSVEFPDHRILREGSCFSIEPGLYKKEFGCRTEINGYIRDGGLVISGGPIQTDFLILR
jgi:Xaa-Pro aminopeptidase